MKKHFITALIAVGLLATLNSCSKDDSVEQAEPNLVKQEGLSGDPTLVADSNIMFFHKVNESYLLNTPMKLDKYTEGHSFEAVSNDEININFHGTTYKDSYATCKWGSKPYVVDEKPILLNLNQYYGKVITISLSKKVKEFGFEFNSEYFGYNYGITESLWNSSTKTKVAEGQTLYLGDRILDNPAQFGKAAGACLFAVKSDVPFDEIRISIEDPQGRLMPTRLDHKIASIRYKLAD